VLTSLLCFGSCSLQEIDELIRADKVSNFISQAESALKSGDYGSAVRICDSALRLDAGNTDVQRILKLAQPKFDAQERSRRSGLNKTELLKEEGDEHYKKAQFEDAIVSYTKCIDALKDRRAPLAIKCFSNRSACYKQLSNFDGTIEDTSAVLDVEPTNVKALMRRAQAFEAIERYRYALQDVRAVLAMPADVVGAANVTLANGMQHRLNRVVQQLKQSD
jgi:stress-induced-phosphoprotein 1